MGKEAAKTKLVERFIYSCRSIGKYTGWIILLTDAPTDRYESLLYHDWTTTPTPTTTDDDKTNSNKQQQQQQQQKLIVMKPLPIHYNTQFKQRDMTFKRFKTYAIDYVRTEPRLKDVQLIYYLDVDIVFVRPVSQFFHGLESQYGITNTPNSQSSLSTNANSTIWMFSGNADKVQVQGGQMILSVSNSIGCLDRWRHLIDKNPKNRKDQFPLMEIWKEQQKMKTNNNKKLSPSSSSSLQCEIVRMQQESYISFPNRYKLKKKCHKF